jgi:hypothetical protein
MISAIRHPPSAGISRGTNKCLNRLVFHILHPSLQPGGGYCVTISPPGEPPTTFSSSPVFRFTRRLVDPYGRYRCAPGDRHSEASVHLFICSSVHLFICSSVHLFIWSSVHQRRHCPVSQWGGIHLTSSTPGRTGFSRHSPLGICWPRPRKCHPKVRRLSILVRSGAMVRAKLISNQSMAGTRFSKESLPLHDPGCTFPCPFFDCRFSRFLRNRH